MQSQPPRAHLVPANSMAEHRRLQQKQIRVEKTKEMAKTTKQLELEAAILEEQAQMVRRIAEAEQKKADLRSMSLQKQTPSFTIRDSAGRKLSRPKLDPPTEDALSAPWLVKKGCRGYEEAIRKKLQAQRQQEEDRHRSAQTTPNPDPNKLRELDNFLNQIGMNQYTEPVKRAGVTSVDQLKQFDIKKLNLLPGYEIKLAKRLAEFKATLEVQGKLSSQKTTQPQDVTAQHPSKLKPPSASQISGQVDLGMTGTSFHQKPARSSSNHLSAQVGVFPKPRQLGSGPAPTGHMSSKPKSLAALQQKGTTATHSHHNKDAAMFVGNSGLSDDEGQHRQEEGCSECGEHYRMQTLGGFRANKQPVPAAGKGKLNDTPTSLRQQKVGLQLESSRGSGFASNRSNKFSSIVEKHRSIHSDSTMSEARRELQPGDRANSNSWKDTSFKSDSQEVSASQDRPTPSKKATVTTSSGTDAPKQAVPVCCWRCLTVKQSKQEMVKSPLFAEPQRLFCSARCLDLETRDKFVRCNCGRPAEKGNALCHNGRWYCRADCIPIEEQNINAEGDEEFGAADLETFTEGLPDTPEHEDYLKQLHEEVDLDFEELI